MTACQAAEILRYVAWQSGFSHGRRHPFVQQPAASKHRGPDSPVNSPHPMTLHQGQMVRLTSSPDHTYQVLSIDLDSRTCWVRRWPLFRHGSPAFALTLDQLQVLDTARA